MNSCRRNCLLGALGAALMAAGDLALSMIPPNNSDSGLYLREAFLRKLYNALAPGGVVVCVGPGDPELLTLKAVKTLKTADIIVCPAKEAVPGLAYQIAQQACPFIASKEQMAIGFPMKRGDLTDAHQEAADQIMQHLRSGKNVAFLTLGDPGFYSTFNYVVEIIKENGYETEVINGIPSFCAASARIKIPVVSGSEAVLITSGEFCNFDGTLVIMKAGRRLQNLKDKISATGKNAYLIENCGMPDEKVYCGIQSMPEEAGYLSILFVK